jgi:hypothetical protein
MLEKLNKDTLQCYMRKTEEHGDTTKTPHISLVMVHQSPK